MSWLSRHLTSRSHGKQAQEQPDEAPPPDWAPAPERSRAWGLKNEAPDDEYQKAEEFCKQRKVEEPKFLASYDVDRIKEEGAKAWEMVSPTIPHRFRGTVTNGARDKKGGTKGTKVVEIITESGCGDVCILSNYPIMAGLYDIQGKEGIYYEVKILKMEGIIAIGTACRPYPQYRFPGWNRLSAGLHLDDFQKFFEDPDGGRPYDSRLTTLQPGDVIGCGYEFRSGSLFYTYNGERLDTAFRGIYMPREQYDVYAAIGVGGPGANHLLVNFGGDDGEHLYRWKPGREWAWQVDGHVGRLAGSSSGADELPAYSTVA